MNGNSRAKLEKRITHEMVVHVYAIKNITTAPLVNPKTRPRQSVLAGCTTRPTTTDSPSCTTCKITLNKLSMSMDGDTKSRCDGVIGRPDVILRGRPPLESAALRLACRLHQRSRGQKRHDGLSSRLTTPFSYTLCRSFFLLTIQTSVSLIAWFELQQRVA